jgi:hypothetical protein
MSPRGPSGRKRKPAGGRLSGGQWAAHGTPANVRSLCTASPKPPMHNIFDPLRSSRAVTVSVPSSGKRISKAPRHRASSEPSSGRRRIWSRIAKDFDGRNAVPSAPHKWRLRIKKLSHAIGIQGERVRLPFRGNRRRRQLKLKTLSRRAATNRQLLGPPAARRQVEPR